MSHIKKASYLFYVLLGILNIFHDANATTAACGNTTYGACAVGQLCTNSAPNGSVPHFSCTAAPCGGNINGLCPAGYGCINVALNGTPQNYTCVANAVNGACPAGYDWANVAAKNAAPSYACALGVTNNCPNGKTVITSVVQSGNTVGNVYRCENECDIHKFQLPHESVNLHGHRTYCTNWGMRGWDNMSMLTVASANYGGQSWGTEQSMRVTCDANGAPTCTFKAQTHNCPQGSTCPCVLSCT